MSKFYSSGLHSVDATRFAYGISVRPTAGRTFASIVVRRHCVFTPFGKSFLLMSGHYAVRMSTIVVIIYEYIVK